MRVKASAMIVPNWIPLKFYEVARSQVLAGEQME